MFKVSSLQLKVVSTSQGQTGSYPAGGDASDDYAVQESDSAVGTAGTGTTSLFLQCMSSYITKCHFMVFFCLCVDVSGCGSMMLSSHRTVTQ